MRDEHRRTKVHEWRILASAVCPQGEPAAPCALTSLPSTAAMVFDSAARASARAHVHTLAWPRFSPPCRAAKPWCPAHRFLHLNIPVVLDT